MSAIIAVAVCAVIFWGIYKVAAKDLYSEEATKDWPKTEGTILSSNSTADGTEFRVEFWEGGNRRIGETIQYVDARGKYRKGEKVLIRYELHEEEPKVMAMLSEKLAFNEIDAIIVFENPQVISVIEKQRKIAWLWLFPTVGLVICDVVLIVQYILGI